MLARTHFADLHAHLLPAVDDGPSDLEETVELLRVAHRAGTRRIVATPHMFSPNVPTGDAATLRGALEQLAGELRELSLREEHAFLREIEIFPGSENYVSPEFFTAFEQADVLTLNDSRYVLVEFSPFLAAPVVESALQRILGGGMVPVVAHVERYPTFEDQPERLAHLVEMGCILQINAQSLLLSRWSPSRKVCWSLLERGLAQIIASDTHDPNRRSPRMDDAFRRLSRKFPEERIRAWMWHNPSAILEDRPLPKSSPAPVG